MVVAMSSVPNRSEDAGASGDARSIEILEALVAQRGLAGVVGLLAEIASRRSEVLLLAGEDLKAAVWTHDAKTLDRAARTLDGD
jgi:hypothetical protein